MEFSKRRELINWFSIILLLVVAFIFLRAVGVNMNGGQNNTAIIVSEIKKIGYCNDDFSLMRFNIIEHIGGGRSLYSKFKYNSSNTNEIKKYYHGALERNGWIITKEGNFIKDDLFLELDIENNEVIINIKK
jgi:hypothetical protein